MVYDIYIASIFISCMMMIYNSNIISHCLSIHCQVPNGGAVQAVAKRQVHRRVVKMLRDKLFALAIRNFLKPVVIDSG